MSVIRNHVTVNGAKGMTGGHVMRLPAEDHGIIDCKTYVTTWHSVGVSQNFN